MYLIHIEIIRTVIYLSTYRNSFISKQLLIKLKDLVEFVKKDFSFNKQYFESFDSLHYT